VICNAEFDPKKSGSKKLCLVHSTPILQKRGVFGTFNKGLNMIIGLAILVLLSVFLFAIVYSCADTHGLVEFSYPKSVLEHKTAFIDGKTELDVTIKLMGWDAGAGDMFSDAQDMERIMKHESKEGGQEQSIVFHIVGDAGGGMDDYGNTRPEHIIEAFDIRYTMEDIKKINWDNINELRLLNLGTVSGITPAGASVAKKYCDKNQEYSNVFCANF
jgi:hypothetical protein